MVPEIHPDGTVVAERSGHGRYEEVLRLDDFELSIGTYETGTASYKAGTVYTSDTTSIDVLFDLLREDASWVVCDGVYLRIKSARKSARRERYYWEHPHPTPHPHEVECSQAADVGMAIIGGKRCTLRLVEPSPPRPTGEWLDAERARAIRDLVGDERPTVLVPGDGGLVPCDPWQVSE